MRIFFSVGEPSGDLHGANLIKQLRARRPDLEAVGYGGPRMAAAGCRLLEELTRHSVMWFLAVFVRLRLFWRLYRLAGRQFADSRTRPDAVVLIDYPGFNWWVARAAKRHGVPVYYYGVPQMWAWASWRIHKMRRLVDHALCKLPFEADWYQERGCDAQYVGHPYYDEILERRLDQSFVQSQRQAGVEGGAGRGPLVVLLPGSRRQEVVKNSTLLLRTVEHVRRQAPSARFAVASFNEEQAAMFRERAEEFGGTAEIEVHAGRTPELIEAATCCVACSGSVSLELMCAAKPTVVVYCATRLQAWLVKRLIKVKYMTLVNLLAMEDRFAGTGEPFDRHAPGAERVPMPEYPVCEDKSEQVAEHVVEWLTDPTTLERSRRRLAELRDAFAHPGATARAAEYLLTTCGESSRGAARAA